MRTHTLFAATLLSLGLGLAGPAQAERWNVDDGGLFSRGSGAVIEGYDPVAYFTEGKPVKGSAQFTATYEGATFHFASAANRDQFVADPAKYAPQYGGFCAWAVSQGYTAEIDPDAWRIVDGKLYLNYDRQVQQTWARDIPGNIRSADGNWPRLRDE